MRVNPNTMLPAQAAAKLILELGPDEAYWEAEDKMKKASSEAAFDWWMAVMEKIDRQTHQRR